MRHLKTSHQGPVYHLVFLKRQWQWQCNKLKKTCVGFFLLGRCWEIQTKSWCWRYWCKQNSQAMWAKWMKSNPHPTFLWLSRLQIDQLTDDGDDAEFREDLAGHTIELTDESDSNCHEKWNVWNVKAWDLILCQILGVAFKSRISMDHNGSQLDDQMFFRHVTRRFFTFGVACLQHSDVILISAISASCSAMASPGCDEDVVDAVEVPMVPRFGSCFVCRVTGTFVRHFPWTRTLIMTTPKVCPARWNLTLAGA